MPRVSALRTMVRRGDFPMVAALAALILVIPSLLSTYDLYVATTAAIFSTVVLGLGIVSGRAGMISLAQLAFMAIGAYVFIWLQLHVPGIPFLVAMLIAALVTLPIGILVGLPALRLRGVHLAVATLALAAACSVVLQVNGFPGLNAGFTVTRPSAFTSETDYFWLCGAIFAVLAIATSIVGRTRLGLTWSSVRHSERATAALGRSVFTAKLSAFGVSAFCAGLGGALLVGQIGLVSGESFEPLASLIIFALAIMVGARYPEGALIGGVLYAFMPVFLSDLGIAQDIGNLLFAVGAVLGMRGGFGIAEEIREALRRRRRRRTPASEPAVVAPLPPIDVPSTNGVVTPEVPALEIRGLTHAYGNVLALDSVDLTVMPGTVAALIGPNGAGKSTLIDSVTGFVHGSTGQVFVAGTDVTGLIAHRRAGAGVRRTFQQGRTIPDLTIEEYIRVGLSHDQVRELDSEQLVELLAFFDCPGPATRIADIDVGTRRLLEVAAAVAARPAVVLLDEPAAGLAASDSASLAERIAEIPRRYGPAVLLVEHDMELVNTAASHVVVVDFGKVIAAGPTAAVMTDSNVMRAYLGEEVMV